MGPWRTIWVKIFSPRCHLEACTVDSYRVWCDRQIQCKNLVCYVFNKAQYFKNLFCKVLLLNLNQVCSKSAKKNCFTKVLKFQNFWMEKLLDKEKHWTEKLSIENLSESFSCQSFSLVMYLLLWVMFGHQSRMLYTCIFISFFGDQLSFTFIEG